MTQHKLPPSGELERRAFQAVGSDWYEYPVTAYPHHTDYAGIVWHGTYIQWLEESRIACLKSLGIDFAELVRIGCDLPVVEIDLRYHRFLRMGEAAIMKARMLDSEGVRITWQYELVSHSREILHLSGTVTLVAVDREKGKIMRQLPAAFKEALVRYTR
jgi:acyl-CoA thioester hydrolase